MNPNKYKSVAVDIDTWHKATAVGKKLVPYITVSRKRVVELAVEELAKKHLSDNVTKVSFQKLNRG